MWRRLVEGEENSGVAERKRKSQVEDLRVESPLLNFPSTNEFQDHDSLRHILRFLEEISDIQYYAPSYKRVMGSLVWR